MDYAWQIDVRKATARIPQQLVREMRRIADATPPTPRRRIAIAVRGWPGFTLPRGRSSGAPGSTKASSHIASIAPIRWSRRHSGRRRRDRAPAPSRGDRADDSIVMDARERPDSVSGPFEGRADEVRTMLREAYRALVAHGADPSDAVRVLAGREPFDSHADLVAALAEEVAS